ncbi:hypothetical protein D9M68_879220 [compost metagenome]
MIVRPVTVMGCSRDFGYPKLRCESGSATDNQALTCLWLSPVGHVLIVGAEVFPLKVIRRGWWGLLWARAERLRMWHSLAKSCRSAARQNAANSGLLKAAEVCA